MSDQTARIIRVVLGILGYAYGSILGVFLCGIFTKRQHRWTFDGKLYSQQPWLPFLVDLVRYDNHFFSRDFVPDRP